MQSMSAAVGCHSAKSFRFGFGPWSSNKHSNKPRNNNNNNMILITIMNNNYNYIVNEKWPLLKGKEFAMAQVQEISERGGNKNDILATRCKFMTAWFLSRDTIRSKSASYTVSLHNVQKIWWLFTSNTINQIVSKEGENNDDSRPLPRMWFLSFACWRICPSFIHPTNTQVRQPNRRPPEEWQVKQLGAGSWKQKII